MNRVIEFAHPSQPGGVSRVFVDQIFAVMLLPEAKVVAVVGPGGAMVPVAGTLDEVTRLVADRKSELAAADSSRNTKRKNKNNE